MQPKHFVEVRLKVRLVFEQEYWPSCLWTHQFLLQIALELQMAY
jgi:hypothetical protein